MILKLVIVQIKHCPRFGLHAKGRACGRPPAPLDLRHGIAVPLPMHSPWFLGVGVAGVAFDPVLVDHVHNSRDLR